MSRVTRAALGAAASPAGLDTPAPGGRFRRTVALAVPTGGAAQAASVAAGAALQATFAAREVDALAAGAPEPASLAAGGAGLVLSLPVARRLARVRLRTAEAGDRVAAFRFDGAAVSEQAVAAPVHAAGGAALEVTDARLVLRRRRGEADLALAAGEVAGAILRYAPVNPRLGFSVAGDAEGETFLPPLTDAAGQPVFPAAADRGAAFAQALSDRLARRPAGATLPNPLVVTLILEADEPCTGAIAALDLTLVLERRGFAEGEEKQVLRFPGGRREVRRLALAVPAGAQPLSARLDIAASATAGTGGATAAGTGENAQPPIASAEGVGLLPDAPVGTRIPLDAAAAALGAEAVLAAPEGAAEVVASLWEERDGLPGARLAESAPVPVAGARPVAVPFGFPRPMALPAGPAWLVLTATRGRAVALLAPASSGEGSVAAAGGAAGFARLAAAAGRALAARLRSPATPLPPGGGAAGAASGFSLSVAGAAVPLQAAEGGGRRFTAELVAAGALLPQHAGGVLEIAVASDARLLVTVDPPVLRYGLG